MSKETKKWWEEASESYQKECRIPIRVHYGPAAPFEDQLNLIGSVKGKKLLEVGCGGAQCGIAFAKQGAKVIGIDISEEQLKFAKKLAEKNKVKIKLIKHDIQDLKPVSSNSQDIVFSAYALLYVGDLLKCFKEVNRVLKKDGIFVFSIDHPVYNILDFKTLKIKKSYLLTGKIQDFQTWRDKTKHKWIAYQRKISDIFNSLVNSNFFIEKMIEPDSRKKYPGDPWQGLWEYKPKLLKLFPPTIIFKARKLK